MKAEDENKPTTDVAAEGEKVTGGTGNSAETETNNNSESGGEATSDTETKKEEMNSYNELPDQAKVGGG